MNQSISPLFGLACFALPFVALALGLIVFLLVRRARRPKESVCGRCGYIVHGLTTFTCPECGSDLREVGIVAGKSQKSRVEGHES